MSDRPFACLFTTAVLAPSMAWSADGQPVLERRSALPGDTREGSILRVDLDGDTCAMLPNPHDGDFLKVKVPPEAIQDPPLKWENPFSFFDLAGGAVAEMALRCARAIHRPRQPSGPDPRPLTPPITSRRMKHHPLALATQRCVLGVVLVLASTRAPAADSPPAVVCFGDSITKRGYPDELGKRLGVATINAGVGGNTTTAGLKRMQREVLDLKPRVVVIFFGTNDSRVDAPKIHVPVDHYVANLRQMITRCAAIQARVVLCTVPPINPEPYFQRHVQAVFDEAGGLSKILDGYRAAVRRLGTELDLPVVDLAQQLASEPAWLSADGVHPTPAGNAILAKLIAEKVSPLLGSRSAPHANP